MGVGARGGAADTGRGGAAGHHRGRRLPRRHPGGPAARRHRWQRPTPSPCRRTWRWQGAGRLRVDTAGGGRRATVAYPLTAWRPGEYQLPPVAVAIVQDGVQRRVQVTLPAFTVSSVLPADTAGVEARPAKDVLGASRLWWPHPAGPAAGWRWRPLRSGPGGGAGRSLTPSLPEPCRPCCRGKPPCPGCDALAASGLLERGEFKTFYEQLTETCGATPRGWIRSWGVDLTTTELALACDGGFARRPPRPPAGPAAAAADLVKFARGRPTANRRVRDLAAARRGWSARHRNPLNPGCRARVVRTGGSHDDIRFRTSLGPAAVAAAAGVVVADATSAAAGAGVLPGRAAGRLRTPGRPHAGPGCRAGCERLPWPPPSSPPPRPAPAPPWWTWTPKALPSCWWWTCPVPCWRKTSRP
jgi:hypothetical protein